VLCSHGLQEIIPIDFLKTFGTMYI
jgi:hypothetical protein